MVPSSKVPSYDEKPEMSAYEITDKLLEQIQRDYYDFIAVNFANGDLVGHSANLDAGIKACEAVDDCVGKIVELGLDHDYTILITGDHGNVEIMFYPDGQPCPAHGTNPVPFIIVGKGLEKVKLSGDGLESIAPTILELMNIEKPDEMTGVSLLQ